MKVTEEKEQSSTMEEADSFREELRQKNGMSKETTASKCYSERVNDGNAKANKSEHVGDAKMKNSSGDRLEKMPSEQDAKNIGGAIGRGRRRHPLYDMIGKREQRKEELEKMEGDLQQRLDMLECSVPAVMVWNIWRMAQGAPCKIKRILKKQFEDTKQLPSTPSHHYDCRVREVEAERKLALRKVEEARNLWSEKLATLEQRKKKLDEARKVQEEQKCAMDELNEKIRTLQESMEKAEDESCVRGECGDIQYKQKQLEKDQSSVMSIKSTDIQYLEKLQRLAEEEMTMKRDITELEQREEAYMKMLQQADDLWAKMEDDAVSEASQLQEQLDMKTTANQELANRVCELEDALEKCRARLTTCRAELEKFVSVEKVEAMIGRDDDIAIVMDKEVFTKPEITDQLVGLVDLAVVKDAEVLAKVEYVDKEMLTKVEVADKEEMAAVAVIDADVDAIPVEEDKYILARPDVTDTVVERPVDLVQVEDAVGIVQPEDFAYDEQRFNEVQQYLAELDSLDDLYKDDDKPCAPDFVCNDVVTSPTGMTDEELIALGIEPSEIEPPRKLVVREELPEREVPDEEKVEDIEKKKEVDKIVEMMPIAELPVYEVPDAKPAIKEVVTVDKPITIPKVKRKEDIVVEQTVIESWVDTIETIREKAEEENIQAVKDNTEILAKSVGAYLSEKISEKEIPVIDDVKEIETVPKRELVDEKVDEEKVRSVPEEIDELEIEEIRKAIIDKERKIPPYESVEEMVDAYPAIAEEVVPTPVYLPIPEEEVPDAVYPDIAEEEVPDAVYPDIAEEEVPDAVYPDIAEEEVPDAVYPDIAEEEVVPNAVSLDIPEEEVVPDAVSLDIPEEEVVPDAVCLDIPEEEVVPDAVCLDIPEEEVVPDAVCLDIPEEEVPDAVCLDIPEEEVVPDAVCLDIPEEEVVPDAVCLDIPEEEVVPDAVCLDIPEEEVPDAVCLDISEEEIVPDAVCLDIPEEEVPDAVCLDIPEEEVVPDAVCLDIPEEEVPDAVCLDIPEEEVVSDVVCLDIPEEEVVPDAVCLDIPEEEVTDEIRKPEIVDLIEEKKPPDEKLVVDKIEEEIIAVKELPKKVSKRDSIKIEKLVIELTEEEKETVPSPAIIEEEAKLPTVKEISKVDSIKIEKLVTEIIEEKIETIIPSPATIEEEAELPMVKEVSIESIEKLAMDIIEEQIDAVICSAEEAMKALVDEAKLIEVEEPMVDSLQEVETIELITQAMKEEVESLIESLIELLIEEPVEIKSMEEVEKEKQDEIKEDETLELVEVTEIAPVEDKVTEKKIVSEVKIEQKVTTEITSSEPKMLTIPIDPRLMTEPYFILAKITEEGLQIVPTMGRTCAECYSRLPAERAKQAAEITQPDVPQTEIVQVTTTTVTTTEQARTSPPVRTPPHTPVRTPPFYTPMLTPTHTPLRTSPHVSARTLPFTPIRTPPRVITPPIIKEYSKSDEVKVTSDRPEITVRKILESKRLKDQSTVTTISVGSQTDKVSRVSHEPVIRDERRGRARVPTSELLRSMKIAAALTRPDAEREIRTITYGGRSDEMSKMVCNCCLCGKISPIRSPKLEIRPRVDAKIPAPVAPFKRMFVPSKIDRPISHRLCSDCQVRIQDKAKLYPKLYHIPPKVIKKISHDHKNCIYAKVISSKSCRICETVVEGKKDQASQTRMRQEIDDLKRKDEDKGLKAIAEDTKSAKMIPFSPSCICHSLEKKEPNKKGNCHCDSNDT